MKTSDILQLPGLNMTHKQLFFVAFAQVNTFYSIAWIFSIKLNFHLRFGALQLPMKRSIYKLKKIHTVRQTFVSLEHYQTFLNLPKNLIARSVPK